MWWPYVLGPPNLASTVGFHKTVSDFPVRTLGQYQLLPSVGEGDRQVALGLGDGIKGGLVKLPRWQCNPWSMCSSHQYWPSAAVSWAQE